MKALRIWYFIDRYSGPTAGTERQLLMLIEGMLGLGHEVRLLVLRHTDYTASAQQFPCPIDSLEIRSMASIRTLRRMLDFRSRVRREQPDVVHTFFNDSAMLVPMFARTGRTRVFTSRRDVGFWYTAARMPPLRLANLFADGIICNSQAVAGVVHEREGVPWRKLKVIHNGIVTGPVAGQAAASEREGRREDMPDDGALNLCLVANLRPIKRIEDFIRAAAKVVATVPGCRFWIVGAPVNERYAAFLAGLVEQLGLGEVVRFLGLSANPAAILRRCQVGVLTSESEGLSNTLLEYLNEGLPAVCSAVGGNGEVVRHGETGLLYPCGDVDALAARLVELCKDASLRKRLAAQARASAAQFSVEAALQRHLDTYVG
jgi:glycosyltransferase involved in cell wall biosynthesis